jgi:hypothetical protein
LTPITRYDERGNQIEVAYLDEAGKPVRHKDGYAKWTARYPMFGVKPPGSAAAAREIALFSRLRASGDPSPTRKV